MAGPLLETKFHVPRRGRGLVARPRLINGLTHRAESALTLVSAPAGFGKTTLLTEWLAEWLAVAPVEGRSAAWLSLDERDNDPALFWRYLVAALEAAAPGVGSNALGLLQTPQPSTEAVLATLLNDLNAVANDVVLVLDDFHVIETPDVQTGIAFLLENLPPRIHLVIAARADPSLPLARLRGRGELVEVRAAELRFTPDEAAGYLNGAMGLALTPEEVDALEGRTEGWIAALQLAALSMQGREDVAGYIAGFAGDDRYIVDYLAEEVLQRQPEQIRGFLLQTSILSRLTGSLCDAVTGQDDGKVTLEALDRANLFLVPLDDRRRWYRYHHLFADVLQAHLRGEQAGRLPELHLRASDWYEQNGDRAEAIDHALAGADVERAAELVERSIPDLRRNRQEATLRSWLEALPEELYRIRPVLSMGFAASLMARGDIEGVEERLRQAERWLGPATDQVSEMVVVDEEAFRTLPTAISMYRAGTALVRGDVAGTITHARRALELADEDDQLARGAPTALLGLAYWTTGDLDAASGLYVDGMASLERAGYHSDVLGGSIALADMRLAQGRLRDATSIFERGLQRAKRSQPVLRGAADMHVGLSQLLCERDKLDSARQHLQASRELGDYNGLPQNRYRWRVAMARIREAEGDLVGALDLLGEAERLYVGDFSPDVRPVPAMRARVLVVQGEWRAALDWARERGLSADDDVSYLHEFEHVTLARALLARYSAERDERSIQAACGLLQRLGQAADEGGRTGSLIEILVVRSLAHQARGDIPLALGGLRRGLTLAQPEGYVRIFADEGPPMASLLRAVAKQGTPGGYVRRLLAAVGATAASATVSQGLVDPLSARELDVLRLLGSDLDGPDIARELVVSLNTVRTHTKNIYAKLGVNNRRAAVRLAHELDLMPRRR
jgi:LuxR family transcriptional regulator, maltose regulon positive regulatory protein